MIPTKVHINMKKKIIVFIVAVMALAVLVLIFTSNGKWLTENAKATGVVADFNDRQNEKLLNATLIDQGTYWELKDNGADNWFESTLTFILDGFVPGITYTAYIDAVGDWSTAGGGYWLIYDRADSETPLVSQVAVDKPVSIQFIPSASTIKIKVMPAESLLWDKGIKTAHFANFRIESGSSEGVTGADNVGDLTAETTVNVVEETSSFRPEFAGKTCVCFGDSVTGFMEPPNDYPSVLASRTGMTVYNVGYAGCRMSDTHPYPAYKRFGMVPLTNAILSGDWSEQDEFVDQIETETYPQEHLANLKRIDWSTVDYITIFYGGNDAGNYVLIDNPKNPTDTSTYLGAARYIYNRWHTAYPDIKIMFFVPMYRYWKDEGKDSNEMQFEFGEGTHYYYDWGDALIEYFTSIGVPTVDMYRTLGIDSTNRTVYLKADGAHPSEAGNRLIAYKFEEQLYKAFLLK